jgi:hypothetical protein
MKWLSSSASTPAFSAQVEEPTLNLPKGPLLHVNHLHA